MKRLGSVLVATAILIVGVGFYRGWFAVSHPAADPGTNKVNINLAANPDKLKQDVKIVTDKASALTGGSQPDGQTTDVIKSK